MRALLSRFSISQINGIRYQFLTVIALRAQQSIQKRKPPLGFLIKITSIAIGDELALINPLSRYLSKYFYSTQSLFQDILYRGLNLGSFPPLIIILQLYSQRSSSLLASSYKNISRQGRRVLFIKCQNKLKAFIRLNGITKYLNNLYRVQNIVSYLSPSII